MTTDSACNQCQHLKAIKYKPQQGDRAPKGETRLICTVRRMNVTNSRMIHCSTFNKAERRGRPPKGDR